MAEIRKHRPSLGGPISEALERAARPAGTAAGNAPSPRRALEPEPLPDDMDADEELFDPQPVTDPWVGLEPPTSDGLSVAALPSTEGWEQFVIPRPHHAEREDPHQ